MIKWAHHKRVRFLDSSWLISVTFFSKKSVMLKSFIWKFPPRPPPDSCNAMHQAIDFLPGKDGWLPTSRLESQSTRPSQWQGLCNHMNCEQFILIHPLIPEVFVEVGTASDQSCRSTKSGWAVMSQSCQKKWTELACWECLKCEALFLISTEFNEHGIT